MSTLNENWLTWYLGGADSKSRLIFLKFQPQNSFSRPKKSKLFFLSESWHTWCLKETGSYSDISFLNFSPKINFWGNLGQKSHRCRFFLKIGTRGIFWMLILIPTFVFSNFKPKSLGYWFLFWDYFFEIPNVNPFLSRILHFACKLEHRISWGCDCKDREEGLQAEIIMNNCIKCLLLLYLYCS